MSRHDRSEGGTRAEGGERVLKDRVDYVATENNMVPEGRLLFAVLGARVLDDFDAARELYRDGKLLLDATRDAAAGNDELRWAREDAEEDLLDLKLAVIDGNIDEVPERIDDVHQMILVILRIIDPPADVGERESS